MPSLIHPFYLVKLKENGEETLIQLENSVLIQILQRSGVGREQAIRKLEIEKKKAR